MGCDPVVEIGRGRAVGIAIAVLVPPAAGRHYALDGEDGGRHGRTAALVLAASLLNGVQVSADLCSPPSLVKTC